eukprot:scaffold47135_cov83-Cyclotella_meneghiniana.AAC.1
MHLTLKANDKVNDCVRYVLTIIAAGIRLEQLTDIQKLVIPTNLTPSLKPWGPFRFDINKVL